jgi:type III secretion protein N (ATPase)
MTGIVPEEHKKAAAKLREVLATYEKQRDLITLGAYQYGTDERTDYAIDKIEAVEAFLRQSTDEKVTLEEAVEQLVGLFE